MSNIIEGITKDLKAIPKNLKAKAGGMDTKKLVLLNLPYIFVGYFCDKVAWLWRVSEGTNASDKMMAVMNRFDKLFANPLPSFHPRDLLIGVAGGIALRLVVYYKAKNTLSEDKILIPSAYARQNHPEDCQCTNYHDPYTWNATTVGYILNRREYLGHTVLGKTTRDNFKTKRKRIANEDELLVFYNTHEAIIDQETYDKAQRMRKRVSPRRNSEKPAHRLSGLLYCADCGSRLAYINSKPKDGKIYDSNQAFRCSRYHNKYHSCTGHYIKAGTIEMLIYQATKRVSQYVLKDEKEFVEQLKAQYELQCEKDNTDDKKELLEAKRRMMDLDDLIKGLYENFTLGRLPERQFNRLMTEYDTEQSSLEQRISELETATERISTKAVQIDKFVRLVKKYRDFEELTTPMLNDFIEKVVIHEAEGGRTKDRTQQVDIYFNFIGNFVLPLSEDEVEALQSEEARRAEEIAERKRKSSKKSTQKRNQKRAEIKAKAEAGDFQGKEQEDK